MLSSIENHSDDEKNDTKMLCGELVAEPDLPRSVDDQAIVAIARQLAAQRRHSAAHFCIMSSSPNASQLFAQASHTSAHTRQVA